MKKQYIEPQTIELFIGVNNMVCTSTKVKIEDKTTSEEGITESDSRRKDMWEDEEEEEF